MTAWAHKLRNPLVLAVFVGGILLVLGLTRHSVSSPTTQLNERGDFNQSVRFENGYELSNIVVVSSNADRIKGLSGITSLSDDEGMLFLFDSSETVSSFWMKDMLIPIDIIWLSCEGKVVTIHKNLQPNSYPKTFSPSSEAQFVLEVKANLSEDKSIDIGDQVYFKTGIREGDWSGCGEDPNIDKQTAHAIMSAWFSVI